ncbi:MAG: hypothetical protein AABY32_03245 [Nanoarchaeota archaeon]
MNLKNIINIVFPDKETRRKSIEDNLKLTVDEIIKENKSEKKDEYFLIKLIKQYNRLITKAQEYEIDIQDYVNKMDAIYEVK